MDTYFDGTTEVLLDRCLQKGKNPEELEKMQALLQSLFDDCVRNKVCYAGEIRRGYMCRKFLRQAGNELRDKISGMEADAVIGRVLQQTGDYIEHIGAEQEADRAVTVVRNVLIICGCYARQYTPQSFPFIGGKTQRLFLDHCHITDAAVKTFEEMMDIQAENLEEKKASALEAALESNRSAVERRYRTIFLRLAMQAACAEEEE